MGLKAAGEKLAWTPGILNGALTIHLHAGLPDATNELAYPGYAAQRIEPAGWGVDAASGTATNAADIDFPRPTGGGGIAGTHVALKSGAGIVWDGAIAPAMDAPQEGGRVYIPAGALSLSLETDD